MRKLNIINKSISIYQIHTLLTTESQVDQKKKFLRAGGGQTEATGTSVLSLETRLDNFRAWARARVRMEIEIGPHFAFSMFVVQR